MILVLEKLFDKIMLMEVFAIMANTSLWIKLRQIDQVDKM